MPAAPAVSASSGRAIIHQHLVGLIRPVPFEHGEFGMMQHAALAIAEYTSKIDDTGLARCEQFLAGEFGRGMQI